MQNKIEPVLRMDDIVEIFRVSVPTVRRWLQKARQDKNGFPMPIRTPGRVLLWNKDEIETFLITQSQPANLPEIESPDKRLKRHKDAMRILEVEHGVKVKPRTGKEVVQ